MFKIAILLQEYKPDFGLVFMDIKMEKADEELRRMDGAAGLIFLTSLKQYMRKGYEFHAVNYLLKPVKYKNMKEISALLCTQPQFARCHQSFAVNLSFVRGAEGVEAVLTTGERLPISQPKRNGFMQRMAEYWGELL